MHGYICSSLSEIFSHTRNIHDITFFCKYLSNRQIVYEIQNGFVLPPGKVGTLLKTPGNSFCVGINF